MGSWEFLPAYTNVYKDDWLIHDFTLAELKELRRNQRYSIRNADFNGLFQIMTLEEVIEQMFELQKINPEVNESRTNRVGLYIETKMYAFYLDNYGINIAQMLFDTL